MIKQLSQKRSRLCYKFFGPPLEHMFETSAVLAMYVSAILVALLEYVPDALVALIEFACYLNAAS